jgi:pyruvate formate lyase activating enzyme
MLNVWKIDRFALNDGPGIRTLIYCKGCPLRCTWCSNPEGQEPEPNLVFVQKKCIGCGFCVDSCPNRALQLRTSSTADEYEVQIDRANCNMCGDCVSVCSPKALEIWGRFYSMHELLEIIEKDRQVYRESGGGITLTGGEPLYQWKDVRELLQVCHQRGIHTAVETCAYSNKEHFEQMLHQVDWLFIDLKHMDSDTHLKLTGKRNDLILRNTRLASNVLKQRRKILVIRMVVVPGINDGENINAMANFVKSLPYVEGIELLPYHRYGTYKYSLLGRTYDLAELEPPNSEAMARYRKLIEY